MAKKRKTCVGKTEREELVKKFKDTPIGQLDAADVVAYFGEEDLLDEISESAIAHAIDPSDYQFYRTTTDLLEGFSDEELLEQCDYDEIMTYAQKNGDARQWLDLHPKGDERSVSMEDATMPLLRVLMEILRPHSASFLTKKEVIEEITTLVNDYWR